MKILPATRIAFRSLRANKMRSGLTMLGMVIGVAAVIAMVAVGSGANERITAQITSIGSNLIMVLSGSTTAGGLRSGSGGAATLTLGDARAIGGELAAVRYASAMNRTGAQVVFGNQNWGTQVQGVTPEFFALREWEPSAGRLFTPEEVEASAKVALIGETVAKNLFGGEDPVGQVIRIKKVPFTVLGVLAPKGQSPQGQDQDDAVIAPLTTVQQKLQGSARRGNVSVILVQALDERRVAEAEGQVRDLLRQRHKLGIHEEDDFTVRNLSEMLAAAESATRIMGMLLGSIASVSLLVGGIGIMNIMLVSVTERTREIGIRMAVGARDSDILMQFLIEAVVLAVFGGGIGVLVGVGAAVLISRFAGWSTLVSPGAILLAAGFSGAVGLFFGFYPARKASRLDPIEALRYD